MTHTNVTQTETQHNVYVNPVTSSGVESMSDCNIYRNYGVQHRATVLGRGKATGKHKNWYNLQHLESDGSDGKKESLDLSIVLTLKLKIWILMYL